MRDNKQTLRARVALQRESLAPAELYVWNCLIQEKVLGFACYRRARTVAFYSSIGNEVTTTVIAEDAFKTGKAVLYPRIVRGGRLELIRVESREDLRPGRHKILEPYTGRATSKEELEGALVFVPGLAFDLAGRRLGRGIGAYDRLLKQTGAKSRFVALAYEFQIVAEVPTDEWDRNVDYIVTERRIVNCLDAATASLNQTC